MTEPGIHPTAPPNDLPPDRLRLRPDALGRGARSTRHRLRWRYLSFRTVALADGGSVAIGGADHETAVVLVSGSNAVVSEEGSEPVVLEGRASVFDGLPSAFYLPAGRRATVIPNGGGGPDTDRGPTRLAIATAPTRPEVSAHAPSPSTSGPPTSASRSAAPVTRPARSTTSSPPTSRRIGSSSSRS